MKLENKNEFEMMEEDEDSGGEDYNFDKKSLKQQKNLIHQKIEKSKQKSKSEKIPKKYKIWKKDYLRQNDQDEISNLVKKLRKMRVSERISVKKTRGGAIIT